MDFGVMEFTAVLAATVVAFLATLTVLFGAGCAGLVFVWRLLKIGFSSPRK